MQADGQNTVIGHPDRAKEQLGLRAGIDEDQGGFGFFHPLEDFWNCIMGTGAILRRRGDGVKDFDIGIRAGIGVQYAARGAR